MYSVLSTNYWPTIFQHKLWMEQPEDIPTCLAVKPYNKEVDNDITQATVCGFSFRFFPQLFFSLILQEVQKYFKKLKLYKGPALVQEKPAEPAVNA